MPTRPAKLRKKYENTEHAVVILRFEDGHEIEVEKGQGKTFDTYSGEHIKLLAVKDKASKERSLIETRTGGAFADG